jgi:hypothetical protein
LYLICVGPIVGWVLTRPRESDRYEPLPGFTELPAWLWRRTGRGVRIAVGVALLAAIAAAVVLTPEIREAGQERVAAQQRERLERRARLARELREEQRPRFGRSERAASLPARARTMDELRAAIGADARLRVRNGELDGPIRRVQCEPFPRTVDGGGADRDLSRRRGRFACVAVTSQFGATEESVGGVIGHQYRVLVDFGTGRYAYCKVSGQSGPSREQLATTPKACGG